MTIRYISCIRFSIQLMMAELVFLSVMKRQQRFPVRIILSLLSYFAAASGVYFLIRPNTAATVLQILYYFSLFFLTMGMMLYSFDINPEQALFAGVCGYALEHLVFCLSTMLTTLFGWSMDSLAGSILLRFGIYFAADFAFYWFIMRRLSEIGQPEDRNMVGKDVAHATLSIGEKTTGNSVGRPVGKIRYENLPETTSSSSIIKNSIRKHAVRSTDSNAISDLDPRLIILSFAVLFVAIVLSVYTDSAMFEDSSVLLRNVVCKLYGMVCCLLAIVAAFGARRNTWLQKEQEMMENMLHAQGDQQKLSQESINIINIKSHDLKHRLNQIQRISNVQDQKEYIEEIRNAVTMYDNIYRTGNDSLDLVLTEKSIYCQENGIKITSIIDGSCLSFISSTDIYALFGNLLDNAIESVMKETDAAKRLISINIAKRGGGSLIHMENYCVTAPKFQDGLPVTTKEDSNYHGFGTRSIRYITQKYHGDLLMQAKEHKFIVDILFYL